MAPVVALLPVWLIAIGLIWLPLGMASDVSYFFFASMVMLFGVILFSRPVQRIVFARMLGARPPTSRELLALQPAWNIVSQANHFSSNRFVLAVVDSDETNAFACGGHLLVVSSYAIDHLRQDQLTGVLAHELSHHMGGHTVALSRSLQRGAVLLQLGKALADRLQLAPDYALDYVLFHEAIHLAHSDHGEEFTEILARFPDGELASAYLDGYEAAERALAAPVELKKLG